MMEEKILAVDVGSSSVKSALYRMSGERLPGTDSALPYDLDVTRDGGATKDVEELFGLFVRAIDRAVQRAGDQLAQPIAGVAVSTFWHAVLGVDSAGDPTTPVFTWADRRAARFTGELRGRLDPGRLHGRTGCPPHSSYLPAKLLWLASEGPEAFARTERWISPGEYFYLRLFGPESLHVGVSMASGAGLMNLNRNAWDEETLAALPIADSRLSQISEEPHGGLLPEWSRRWPALNEASWFPAAGDGACSNVGIGATGPQRSALMVGTSGAMRVMWEADSVEVPAGLWCYRPDRGRFISGGALSDGGNLVAWLQKTLRLPEPEKAEEEISNRAPGSHGLDFLPLLAGERGPEWSDLANGAVTGLSMSTEPIDILHAAMEAVALRFALIWHTIERCIPSQGERGIIATGGGLSNSPAWTRMMADALGHPVTMSGAEEASSRGAALLAAERLGGSSIAEFDAPLADTIEPDNERHQAYLAALRRQLELYGALVDPDRT
jgi:gluconokinase